MHYFEIFVTIMGIVMSLGYFPQAYKIWKNKNAESISLVMYIISAIGTATWCVYGILTNNFVVFISFIFGVIGSWTILFLTLRYGKQKISHPNK